MGVKWRFEDVHDFERTMPVQTGLDVQLDSDGHEWDFDVISFLYDDSDEWLQEVRLWTYHRYHRQDPQWSDGWKEAQVINPSVPPDASPRLWARPFRRRDATVFYRYWAYRKSAGEWQQYPSAWYFGSNETSDYFIRFGRNPDDPDDGELEVHFTRHPLPVRSVMPPSSLELGASPLIGNTRRPV